MLDIADDLSSFTLAAGEPFILDLVLLDADGVREPLAGRAFLLSFHDDERVVLADLAGTRESDGTGGFVRFARDGALSDALFGRPATVEIAERLPDGRAVLATGRLAVTASAAGVAPLAGAVGRGLAARIALRRGERAARVPAGVTHVPALASATAPPPPPPPSPSPSVTLGALTLRHAALVAGRAAAIEIVGASDGSTLTATLPAGLTLDGPARTIAGVPEEGEHPVALVEALAGATNSPRTSALVMTVAGAPRVWLSEAVALAEGDAGSRAFVYTVARAPAAGAVSVPWTFSAGDTAPADFAGSTYPAGGSVTMADGVASGSFTVVVAGDTGVEGDERFGVAIVPPPGYAGGSAVAATGTILNDDVVQLAGFAANGATNPTLRAAVARVRAGTGRGRIVWKGDSVTVGQGAGSEADRWRLTGARPRRIPAVVAALLSARGTPALDGAMVCDNGILRATGQALATAYDPRIALLADGGSSWDVQGVAELAGGGYWRPGTNRLRFAPDAAADSFEVTLFRSNTETYRLTIDGAAPAEGPATIVTAADRGFERHRLKATSGGSHALAVTGANGLGALRSIMAWDSAVPAIDMLVHAALGAQAAHQAATGNGWSNREALVFDAPDLTVVMLGLNDMAGGVGIASYAASLTAIVSAARLSGDVLLVFPPPAGEGYNRDVAAFRDAAAGVARDASVAFLSLWDHYGPFGPAIGARMADGVVHPDAAFAADIAGVIVRALALMAPQIG